MKRYTVVVWIVVVLLLSTGVGVSTSTISGYLTDRRATDKKLTAIAEQNQRNGQILVDCTQPGLHPPTDPDPDCYSRGRVDQATALTIVNLGVACVIQVLDHTAPPACDPIAQILQERGVIT